MRLKWILALIVVVMGTLFIWQGVQPVPVSPPHPRGTPRPATTFEKQVHDIHEQLDRTRLCKSAAPDDPYCK